MTQPPSQRLSIELEANSKGVEAAIGNVESRITSMGSSLGIASQALDRFFNISGKGSIKNVIPKELAGDLERTLKVFQSAGTAASTFSRSLESVSRAADPRSVRLYNAALDNMQKSLRRVSGTSKDQFQAQTRTLSLMDRAGKIGINQATIDDRRAAASLKVASAKEKEAGALLKAAQAAEAEKRAAFLDTPQGRKEMGSQEAARTALAEQKVTTERQRSSKAAMDAARSEQKLSLERQESNARTSATTALEERRRTQTDQTSASLERQTEVSNATRYALYEVAAAYTALATVTVGAAAAVAKTAIEFEAFYAQVARTTQADAAPLRMLREELVAISTDIPVAFEELSKISTLGAQMDIPAQSLDEFSEVVAKFSATTDVSVDTAAMGFGRLTNMIDEMDETQFMAMASTISELGTATVATESEILTIAESIATTANMAGFSASEIAGLSAAMASVKIRPELARGGLQRIFNLINEAVGEGGESLGNYADQLGITTEAADEMWRNNPSAFFQQLAESLSEVTSNVERQNIVREQLGIKNTRDIEVISRLANGYEVYAASMDLAGRSYADGTYLDDEAQVIFDTTSSALARLSNAWLAFQDSMGSSSLKPITLLSQALISMLGALSSMPDVLKNGIMGFGSAIGIWAAYKGAVALAMAATIAFRTALSGLGPETGIGASGLLRLVFAKNAHTKASVASTAAVVTESRALVAATAATHADTAAQKPAARITVANTAAKGRLAAALGSVTVATNAAATAAHRAAPAFAAMGRVMRAMPLVTWIALAGGVLTSILSWGDGAEKSTNKMLDAVGGQSALMEALAQDAEEFSNGTQRTEDSLGRLNVTVAAQERVTASATEVVGGQYVDAAEDAEEGVRGISSAIEENIGLIGAHTQALHRQAIMQSDVWENFDPQMLQQIFDRPDFDFREFTDMWLDPEQGADAAEDYINGVIDTFRVETGAMRDIWGSWGYSPQQDVEEVAAMHDTLLDLRGTITGIDGDLDTISVENLVGAALGVDTWAAAADEADEATEGLQDSVEDLGDSMEQFNGVMDEVLTQMFGLIDAEAAVYEAFQTLGESIDENGLDFSASTEAGRANLDALRGSMEGIGQALVYEVEAGTMTAEEAAFQYAGHIESIMAQLENMGVDTSQFATFRSDLDEIFASAIAVHVDTDPATRQLDALLQHARNVFSAMVAMGLSGEDALARTEALTGRAGNLWGTSDKSRTGSATPSPSIGVGSVTSDAFNRNSVQAARDLAAAEREAERAAKERERATEDAARQAEQYADAAEKTAKQIADVNKEIAEINDEGRIFEEILKRLGQEFDKVFSENYGLMQAEDSVTSALHSMKDSVQANKDEVKSLRDEWAKLNAEASQHRIEARQADLFASVAAMYGDEERRVAYKQDAKDARASANEKQNNADASIREANELDQTRLALEGNSRQAIENRSTALGLQQQMIDLIEAYAATGATTEEVTRYAEDLRRKFIDQMVQMGYNNDEVVDLTGVFQDLIDKIASVPRDVRIEVDADTREAHRKIDELKAELAEKQVTPIEFETTQQELVVNGSLRVSDILVDQIEAGSLSKNSVSMGFAGGGVVPGRRPANPYTDNMLATNGSGLFGVQSGEGIINHSAMDYYGGEGWVNAVNSLSLPRDPVVVVNVPQSRSTGPQQVELSAQQIDTLARKVSNTMVMDGRVVASSVNNRNVAISNRGAS